MYINDTFYDEASGDVYFEFSGFENNTILNTTNVDDDEKDYFVSRMIALGVFFGILICGYITYYCATNHNIILCCLPCHFIELICKIFIKLKENIKTYQNKKNIRKNNKIENQIFKKCKKTNNDCSICLDSIKSKGIMLNCPGNHKFHKKCISQWLENNNTCPICRACVYKEKYEEPVEYFVSSRRYSSDEYDDYDEY